MMHATARRLLTPTALALLLPISASPARALTLISSATVDGPSSGTDEAFAAAVDASGNVFVAGEVQEAAGGQNAWLQSFDSSLVFRSSASTVNGSAGGADAGRAVAVDQSGNVFVGGYLGVTGQDFDSWVQKHDSDLAMVSSATLDGAANGADRVFGAVFDAGGVLYAAGQSSATGSGADIWLARYDSSLVLLSSATFTSASSFNDAARGIALDPSGNVYVAGQVEEEGVGAEIWLGRFSSTLVFQASATLNGSGNGNDQARALAVGAGGNVYAVGRTSQTGTGYDVWIGRYDSSLVLVSSLTHSGSDSGEGDEALAVALDGQNNVYVTGYVAETGQSQNLWIAGYDQDLALLSSVTYNGSAGADDAGEGIILGNGGNLIVVGRLNEAAGTHNAFVGKFSVGSSSAVNVANGATLSYAMPGGVSTMTIPAGAFSSNVSILMQGPASLADSGLASIPLRGTGAALEVIVTPALQPSGFVTLTIPYRDSDIAGLVESRLLIARYDSASGVWTPLYSTVDAANNTVTALTDHFSVFQIMAATPSDTVDSVRAFPNPFRPNAGHSSITFVDLPGLSRVRVYTVSGEKVTDVTANAAGVAAWDGRNQAGLPVGPGIYYGYVQSGRKRRKSFKVAVER